MDIVVKLTREENISYYGKDEITIDLEEYLRGVVASEIGNTHIEACAAQAIVSRTFALNTINSIGYITDKSSTHQAFRASRLKGYDNAYKGVEMTRGKVVMYNGKLAKVYYSSSNGGYTTSSKIRWGGDYPYLIGQRDNYDNGKGNGHGVGLSQTGIKNRAKDGHGYLQMISFYFPGTDVTTMDTNELLIKCATENEAKRLVSLLGNGEIIHERGE